MTEKRGYWHLLTGAVIGLMLGMALSAWIIPVQYVNTDPSTLREEDRQAYRIMIAEAYLAEGDAPRANARLALLQDENPSEELIAQAQNLLAEGGSDSQARALALLAAAVANTSVSITPLPPMTPVAGPVIQPTVTATVSVDRPTGTAGPTSTPRPTATLKPTPGSPFEKIEQESVCDPLPVTPQLQVTVLNAAGQPVSGVKIEISQSGSGIESFYTGLYPEISSGYADYEMLPGVNYTIRVGETGQPVPNLTAPACDDGSGGTAYGNLSLVFQQP